MNKFNPQPSCEMDGFAIRPLKAEDLEDLHQAAANPDLWAGHPAKDRWQRPVFEKWFAGALASKSAVVLIDQSKAKLIGCSQYYDVETLKDVTSIGHTFVSTDYWGGHVNRIFKTLMLNHAFETFPEVWFHIDPLNIRSQKATQKIGATFQYEEVIDLAGGACNWFCYRLLKTDWCKKMK